jgi:hypothetical protein
MKIKLQENSLKDPNSETPLVLENIECCKNKHGQWCVSFGSKNHKYLYVDYNTSTNFIDEPLPVGLSAQGFTIETHEEFKDDDCELNLPCHSATLWLIPETKEECDELSGVAAICPTKWAYCACIVQFEDFYA